MVSTIFQPEITNLESQIAQLQAQIIATTERINALGEAESIASNAIESLQTALQKVSTLTPNALDNLKSAVLALFSGDSREAEQETVSTSDTFVDHQNPINLYKEFSDPLIDAQEVDQPFVKLVQVSKALAYQLKQDGEIICTYAGFNNKHTAKRWGEWLAAHYSVASGFEIREAKRLTDYKYELKLWSMSIKQIDKLANCDISLDPRSCYSDAPKHLPPINEAEALDSIQPPLEQQFTYSLLDATNLDQKWSVSRTTPVGKQQFLGSVSCGTDTQRWSHSRQPKYGDIKSFPSKETAAAYLALSYDRDTMPRAGIEPDF